MVLAQRLLGALLIAALTACSAMSISSDYDPSANFSGFRTYGWMAVPQKSIEDPRIDNRLLDSRIRLAVERQLTTKGFEKQSSGTPDFWIHYQAVLKSKLDVNHRYG